MLELTNEEIGKRLRKIREYRDVIQATLAEAFNAKQPKICEFEKGYTTISYADMVIMSKTLYFSLDIFHQPEFNLSACLLPMPPKENKPS